MLSVLWTERMVIPSWQDTPAAASHVTTPLCRFRIASVAQHEPPVNVGFCSSTE